MTRGVVVASQPTAAAAGAEALAAGGNAVDAAVATAFALTVVEPAQCGLGGYGGFLTYVAADGDAITVDFNTYVPARFDAGMLAAPGRGGTLLDGGPSVSPPMVVPGLLAARERLGRLPLAELVAPAVRLARDGFPVHRELARALRDHWHCTGGGTREFAAIFCREGAPLDMGDRLVQPDLAETLAGLDGETFRRGALVDAACAVVAADGGSLEPEDFREERVVVGEAAASRFEEGTVYGPRRRTSGTGITFRALEALDRAALRANRGRDYVTTLAAALRVAWRERAADAAGDLATRGTTHLCAADGEGGIASLSFTHGRRRFGSGLVVPGAGVVLNGGVNLFARSAEGPVAMSNMTPVVLVDAHGSRHAIGAVGGPRVPSIVFTAVVDVVHYDMSLGAALAAPHFAVRPDDGELEGEGELLQLAGGGASWSALKVGETFGPATGLTVDADGAVPAADPRFEEGVTYA